MKINLAAPIKEGLRGLIFSSLPITTNVFEKAEEHVRPLLEDSFRRYKKTIKGYGIINTFNNHNNTFINCVIIVGSVTWERQECGGQVPPAGMVGHTVVIHRDKVVVIGGWANNRWGCDTIYKLHKSMTFILLLF